jgi:predicted metalloprotease with PDZ domain
MGKKITARGERVFERRRAGERGWGPASDSRKMAGVLCVLLLTCARFASAQTVSYTVSIPAPAQHWLQVEATFPAIGSAPLHVFMSRSSPGRYAVHEFAKNVFSFEAFDGKGTPLRATRPSPYQWDVAGHDGSVRVVYKVFGDLVDGTYLAVDDTHAHMNMPATFMFDRDRQERPIRVTFTPPAGSSWKVATQLYPTSDPFTFTAPNLQYFMDSPTEFSDFLVSEFTQPGGTGRAQRFRVVAHTDASQSDVDELAKMVERLAIEHRQVFDEFPEFDTGTYTFLLDYLPWSGGDGMEHRNSTVISDGANAPLKTQGGRVDALDTISHEFFHTWNVERIRPAGLEPFDFTRANITCCLWLAEGFTQYYGDLLQIRAGFRREELPANPVAVINGSGRQVRSAVQMSEYAAFSDAARSVDPTDQSRSFISYYTYGAAIAMALDLTLRARDRSLDDFMRLLWRRHGTPGGSAPGLVARPYTLQDLRALLAELTGDRAFADQFFDRYVEGREVPDFAALLARAGFRLLPIGGAVAWTGVLVSQGREGLVVSTGLPGGALVPFGTPAFDAGLEGGDVITTIDGQPATADAWNALRRKSAGTRVQLTVVRRGGVTRPATLTLGADPALAISDAGAAMTPEQKAFRQQWLGTKVP